MSGSGPDTFNNQGIRFIHAQQWPDIAFHCRPLDTRTREFEGQLSQSTTMRPVLPPDSSDANASGMWLNPSITVCTLCTSAWTLISTPGRVHLPFIHPLGDAGLEARAQVLVCRDGESAQGQLLVDRVGVVGGAAAVVAFPVLGGGTADDGAAAKAQNFQCCSPPTLS